MSMKTRSHQRILLLAMFLIFVVPVAGNTADNLFRFFPEAQLIGFYGDNIGLKSNNGVGGFGGALVAGFYLDYTSAARYASLHYDTFAQLYTHSTQLDRAGEGQYVSATDYENLSSTTKLRLDEFFYRDAPTTVAVITSDQAPAFNTVMAQLLLANDQASVNHVNAVLGHSWGRNWSSDLGVHQTTFFGTGFNSSNSTNYSFAQSVNTDTDYHFNERFSLGAGYRFYDFRNTVPGRPDTEANWIYGKTTWFATKDIYLSGQGGIVISHNEGGGTKVDPGGLGQFEYKFHRGHLSVYGGQEPALNSALGGVGNFRGVRGTLIYNFTPRTTGNAGGGFYQSLGPGFNGQVISWGVGVSNRVNKSVSVYTRFVQVRVTETAANQFLPSGIQSGREAVGNYFVVGMSVSIEAFRWSWQ
jgi:hypothetical protein